MSEHNQPHLPEVSWDQPVPYVRGSDTSRAAAVAKRSDARRQREQVYRALRLYGPQTEEALSEALGLSGNSTRPRLVELARERRAARTGQRRLTRAGRYAQVWTALEEPPPC